MLAGSCACQAQECAAEQGACHPRPAPLPPHNAVVVAATADVCAVIETAGGARAKTGDVGSRGIRASCLVRSPQVGTHMAGALPGHTRHG